MNGQTWVFGMVCWLAGVTTLAAGEIRFTDVSREVGLVEPLSGLMGHGAAWGDLNSDGRPDLYIGGFADRPNDEYAPAPGPVGSLILMQTERGTFEPVRTPASHYARTSGAVWVDLNGDGTDDLYSANNRKGRVSDQVPEPQRSAKLQGSLFLLNRNGVLKPGSSSAVPEALKTARNIGVFDYDGDSRLDLLVVEDRFTKNPRSVLLRNRSDGTFEDVTEQVGLPDDLFGLGCAVADLNGDDQPDFFVGHSNRMFLSNGKGQYTEPKSLRDTFAWEPLHNEDWPCGAAFGDLNRDGRLDLVLALHAVPARNRVYLNTGLKNGVPRFTDVTDRIGLPKTVAEKCPHVEVQDFDNDGWPDLYFSGAVQDLSEATNRAPHGTVTPLIYRNVGMKNGLPRFEPTVDTTKPTETDDTRRNVYFPAGPTCDFDGDGRLDLVLINWFAGNHTRLLKNVGSKGHFLDVRVVAQGANTQGIGTKIWVYPAGHAGDRSRLLGHQEVSTGFGYASGQRPICHFGLGNQTTVDVTLRFPDGETRTVKAVNADQTLRIVQADQSFSEKN